MIRKIKESIGAKTFISILLLLILCCTIIYGMVMIFLPKNYKTELTEQFVSEFEELANVIESNGIEESTQEIAVFAVRNNASVEVTKDEDVIYSFNVTETGNIADSKLSISSFHTIQMDGQYYDVMAMASLEAVSQSLDLLLKLIPFIAVIIILVSVVGAYICSQYFSKPLIDICGVAKRMTKLDMTWKCDVSRSDEIGVLGASLNEMSERLRNALDSLQSANEQLHHDIDQEREQEKQRIDFFTSVSHELKTPITIIKGELEGMIYQVGEYKDRDTYLRHSLRTVEDMEKLVKEILSTARMSGSDFQIAYDTVDVSNMLHTCCRGLMSIAEDKNIEMVLNIEPGFCHRGDNRLLNQAISNIISNAVSYSPKGAAVMVTLRDGILSVENSGIHIEEEDLKQIFQPFYRVDKSRNRNTGGSGLGLYIVQTIFELHRIPYHMENTEQGVKFLVEFS